MMINENKEVVGVNIGTRAISAIYKGASVVWQYVRSCFGKGFWINEKPWLDNDGWKQ